MSDEIWLDFSEAAQEIEQEFGITADEAEIQLRLLCAEQKIRSRRAAPLAQTEFAPPLEPAHPVRRSARPVDEPSVPPRSPGIDERKVDEANQKALQAIRELLSQREETSPKVELWAKVDEHWLAINKADLLLWLGEPAQRSKAVGKRPRIIKRLATMYPDGVPDPAYCPRTILKSDLLRADPTLAPLDEATLKSAIDRYNLQVRNDPN
jgi:hypothetical protein